LRAKHLFSDNFSKNELLFPIDKNLLTIFTLNPLISTLSSKPSQTITSFNLLAPSAYTSQHAHSAFGSRALLIEHIDIFFDIDIIFRSQGKSVILDFLRTIKLINQLPSNFVPMTSNFLGQRHIFLCQQKS